MNPERINWEREPQRPERNVPGNSEYSMFYGKTVDVNKLIKLTERHPVEKAPLGDYLEKLDRDVWADGDGNKVRPRDVIDLVKSLGFGEATVEHPQLAAHIEKIRNADYSYPIHVYQGRVINGAHRLSKLVLKQELGETDQDFVTIKDIKEIPDEILTERDLMKGD